MKRAVLVALLLSGCGADHRALDPAGRDTCQKAYVAGVAELGGRPDAEAVYLIAAYQSSAHSQTSLVQQWRRHHESLGTSERKSQGDADEAVRVLLNVCKATKFVPTVPTPTPTPTSSAPPTP